MLTRLSMGESRETQRQSKAYLPSPTVTQSPAVQQACPECGGVMQMEQLGSMKEYVCHVGHRLGMQTMITHKTNVVERTTWGAIAQSEELVDLLQQAQEDGGADLLGSLQGEIALRRQNIDTLRKVVERGKLSAAEPLGSSANGVQRRQ